MSSQKALIRIRLENDEYVFLLSEYEFESKLFLKILNFKQNEAYIGQVSVVQLRAQASSIRLTFGDFMRKVTNALFERTPDCSDFLYCLEKKDETYVFKWKSIDQEETIINLGNVEMTKRNSLFVFSEVLQSISEEMQASNSKILKLSSELNDCKKQTSEALEQLSVATEVKETLEKEMYSKFILVLNEKKRKIKELQRNSKTHSHSGNNKPLKKRSKKSYILNSDSSDELDGNLDINQPGPSTAGGKNSLLFLDDNKPVVHATQNRIRNRKVPNGKKCNSTEDFISTNPTPSVPKVSEDEDSDNLLSCL